MAISSKEGSQLAKLLLPLVVLRTEYEVLLFQTLHSFFRHVAASVAYLEYAFSLFLIVDHNFTITVFLFDFLLGNVQLIVSPLFLDPSVRGRRGGGVRNPKRLAK